MTTTTPHTTCSSPKEHDDMNSMRACFGQEPIAPTWAEEFDRALSRLI